MIHSLPVLSNTYSINAIICSIDNRIDYDYFNDAARFLVKNTKRTNTIPDELPVEDFSLVHVPYSVKMG